MKMRPYYSRSERVFNARVLTREFEPADEIENDLHEVTSEMLRMNATPRLCEEGR